MKKSEKPIFVDNLSSQLKDVSSLVVVDYTGLSVKMQQELKKRLKAVDGKMLIVKNTLLKKAGLEAKLPENAFEDTVLQGPTAIIYSESDPVSPLQVLYKFSKEFVSEAGYSIPQLKVGIVEGNFQGKDALEKLAQLPSKEILLGQAVGTIASPLYGIVGVLQGNIQKFMYIIQEYKNKRVEESK